MQTTVADAIAGAFAERDIRRMFGVPGGGSSLDLIDAAARRDIDFVLCRTETAAAVMAAVTGELSGRPGVVLTGIGPGAASAVNGIAYAALERAPVILIADAHDSDDVRPPHQLFDQRALFAPISKAQRRLCPETAAESVRALLDLATAHPRGPVQVDLSPAAAVATAGDAPPRRGEPARPEPVRIPGNAAALVAGSRRPVTIAGLQARGSGPAARALAAALGGPAMTTYKASGVIAADDPRHIGLFTGALVDRSVLAEADLIVFFGVDPVEMIPGEWTPDAPVVVAGEHGGLLYPFAPAAEISGPLDDVAAALAAAAGAGTWTAAGIARLRAATESALALAGDGHTAATVTDALAEAAPGTARLAVDAGAHMFSVLGRWPARQPHDVLKSNGLSTMGYAVPAALAGWLETPDRPAVAVTGDGGLLMCLSELSTAARLGARLVVAALDDASLSLIDIKQQRRQMPPLGVRWPAVDLAAAARAMGCAAWSVGRKEPLGPVLARAFDAEGPALVDIAVDPSGYGAQLAAIRG